MTMPELPIMPNEHLAWQQLIRLPMRIFSNWRKKSMVPMPEQCHQPVINQANDCVFITGVMRSGTTLLQRIIAHSLDTKYIREESTLRIPIESFQVLEQYQAYAPLERHGYVEQYQYFFSGLLEAMKREINNESLVLKDPLALKLMHLFHELMPKTKFIISIRNPMSTAASILRVRNRQRQQGKQSFITPMDFGDIVEYIARLCEVIIKMREQDNVFLVQYEELIGHNPVLLQELGSFIGAAIKLDPPDDSTAYNSEHAFWTPESGADIRHSSLEKYQNELTSSEMALVTAKLARFNMIFGYT